MTNDPTSHIFPFYAAKSEQAKACSDFDLFNDQYRKLIFVDWTKETHTNCINGSSEDFWLAVYQKPNFKQLAEFALTCLSVPVSNATVERIFLLLTAVKTNI